MKKNFSIIALAMIIVQLFSVASVFAIGDGIKEGEIYEINVEGWNEYKNEKSMMASLLDEKAILEVKDGKYIISINFNSGTIMGQSVSPDDVGEVWVETNHSEGRGISGNYNESEGKKTYNLPLNTLDLPLLTMEVIPMKEFGMGSQTIRLKIELGDKIQSGNVNTPDPEKVLSGNSSNLDNGRYSINAEALQENKNVDSMTNALIWGPLQLDVSGEKIDVTMLLRGTGAYPLDEVKQLWYRNASGEYIEAKMDFDKASDIIKVRFPVESIDKEQHMQVEVPLMTDLMSSLPIFRLVFDTSTLKSGGSINDPSSAPKQPVVDSFIIKSSTGEGGTISPSGDVKVLKGQNQEFKIKVNEGYKIKYVIVDGKSVGEVETYTFENVESSSTIDISFEKIKDNENKDNGNKDVEENLVFDDVKDHWAKESIQTVVDKELLLGTGNNKFSPNSSMTRGMLVTVLGRLAKAEVDNYGSIPFKDVDSNQYYAKYIAWASDMGIVNGVGDGNFAPKASVTREQLSVIIANYAKFVGFDLSKVNSEVTIDEFADVNSISVWAKESVDIAKHAGIIRGKKDNKFDPKGTATRAEVATIIVSILDIFVTETN